MSEKSFQLKVVSWDKYLDNIIRYQKSYARDQWINGKYSSQKRLYHYSWLDDISGVKLIREPKNIHDKNAIAVYIDNKQIGYISSEENTKLIPYLNCITECKLSIHGGDFRYLLDEEVITERHDPIAELYIVCNDSVSKKKKYRLLESLFKLAQGK